MSSSVIANGPAAWKNGELPKSWFFRKFATMADTPISVRKSNRLCRILDNLNNPDATLDEDVELAGLPDQVLALNSDNSDDESDENKAPTKNKEPAKKNATTGSLDNNVHQPSTPLQETSTAMERTPTKLASIKKKNNEQEAIEFLPSLSSTGSDNDDESSNSPTKKKKKMPPSHPQKKQGGPNQQKKKGNKGTKRSRNKKRCSKEVEPTTPNNHGRYSSQNSCECIENARGWNF
jgi:hypothetical protein